MAMLKPSLAFAGLGVMGFGMASHLLHSGFLVTGYDVYQPSLDKLVAVGAKGARTPREAVQDVEFLIVMVALINHAKTLLFDPDNGAVPAMPLHATILMCSTVAPADIAQLTQMIADVGRPDIRLIDCPVSGGAGRAANGTLSIFASGEDSALDNAQAILRCVSSRVYRMEGLGSGSKAKLIHQIFAGVHIAMGSEAMGLAAVAGFNTKEAYEYLKGGDGASWMFENRVPPMMDSTHPPYSAIAIIRKDVKIITRTSREEKFPLPLLEATEEIYDMCAENGWEKEDDCVVVRLYLPEGEPALVEKQALSFSSVDAPKVSLHDIENLIVGVHLAAMSEAMRFCEHLKIDTDIMYDIVSNAAGASAVFTKFFQEMRRGKWSLKSLYEVEAIKERLVSYSIDSLGIRLTNSVDNRLPESKGY